MEVQPIDKDVKNELKAIGGNEAKIEDVFYCYLAFGTGGLCGVIGASNFFYLGEISMYIRYNIIIILSHLSSR